MKEEGRRKKEVYIRGFKLQLKTKDFAEGRGINPPTRINSTSEFIPKKISLFTQDSLRFTSHLFNERTIASRENALIVGMLC
jgi:hypothetical protein